VIGPNTRRCRTDVQQINLRKLQKLGKSVCDRLDQDAHAGLGLCGAGIDDLQPRIAGIGIRFAIRRATLVMAAACGFVVANIDYKQPMLEMVERTFPGRLSVVGLVPTATQLSFAMRLTFLIPLGDRIDRWSLILRQIAGLSLSLSATGMAACGSSLVAASTVVGATPSLAQQTVPFAAELAEPSRRGSTIGTVMSGLLCGVLFDRATNGAVGDRYGWRAMIRLGCCHRDGHLAGRDPAE